jgi:hypothetical protein
MNHWCTERRSEWSIYQRAYLIEWAKIQLFHLSTHQLSRHFDSRMLAVIDLFPLTRSATTTVWSLSTQHYTIRILFLLRNLKGKTRVFMHTEVWWSVHICCFIHVQASRLGEGNGGWFPPPKTENMLAFLRKFPILSAKFFKTSLVNSGRKSNKNTFYQHNFARSRWM